MFSTIRPLPPSNAGDLAARAYAAMVSIIEAAQPLPPARFSTMTITATDADVGGSAGLNGWARGTGPNGETYNALVMGRLPQAGEVWRVVIGEGATPILDDWLRHG